MKPKLTLRTAANDGFTLFGCVTYYWPYYTDEQCEFTLWEKTCYPNSSEIMLNQLYELYIKENEN